MQINENLNTKKDRKRKNYNQYFTPENVVYEVLTLLPEMYFRSVIDPAVGEGVFVETAFNKWKQSKFFGIDLDKKMVSKLKKKDIPNSFFLLGDSLSANTWNNPGIKKIVSEGGFELVLGNPPFSSWFHRIKQQEILVNYKLAYKNGRLLKSQAIEILFLELFIKLAKAGCYIVIVLPDGILSNLKHKYVREFILKETKVKQIINFYRSVFQDTSSLTKFTFISLLVKK